MTLTARMTERTAPAGQVSYDFTELAVTVENVLKHGFNECYHPNTGAPLRVQNLGMSCTAITMMLNWLTRKHRLHAAEHKHL